MTPLVLPCRQGEEGPAEGDAEGEAAEGAEDGAEEARFNLSVFIPL